MDWFIYSLLAAGCGVAFSILTRMVALKSEEPRAGAMAFNLWAGGFALILFAVTNKSIDWVSLKSLGPVTVFLMIIAFSAYGGFERLQFVVKKHINASTSVILFRLSMLFSFAFSIIFLGEAFTISKLAGVLLILAGNLLIIWKGDVLKLDKYFWLALLCTLFLATAWTVDKVVIGSVNSELYNLALWIMPLPIIFLPNLAPIKIKREFKLGSWKMPAMALANVGNLYFQLLALRTGDASRVIPIVHSSSVVVVILAIWLLNERDNLGKKFIAVGLATLGVILLR